MAVPRENLRSTKENAVIAALSPMTKNSYSTGPLVRMYAIKIEARLLGSYKKLGSFAAYTSFVYLNFLWYTPHTIALDEVLSLIPM